MYITPPLLLQSCLTLSSLFKHIRYNTTKCVFAGVDDNDGGRKGKDSRIFTAGDEKVMSRLLLVQFNY